MVSAASSYQPARAENNVKKCSMSLMDEITVTIRAREGEYELYDECWKVKTQKSLMKTPNHAWVRAPLRGPNADRHVPDADLCDHSFLSTVNISTS